jgi:hypothetical protein
MVNMLNIALAITLFLPGCVKAPKGYNQLCC